MQSRKFLCSLLLASALIFPTISSAGQFQDAYWKTHEARIQADFLGDTFSQNCNRIGCGLTFVGSKVGEGLFFNPYASVVNAGSKPFRSNSNNREFIAVNMAVKSQKSNVGYILLHFKNHYFENKEIRTGLSPRTFGDRVF